MNTEKLEDHHHLTLSPLEESLQNLCGMNQQLEDLHLNYEVSSPVSFKDQGPESENARKVLLFFFLLFIG